MSISLHDILNAVLLCMCLEGIAYLFFPKVIQNFAVNCLVDANPHNLRLVGVVWIVLALFLAYFVLPTIKG